MFVREREESVRTATAVASQRRRAQPLRTDRRDALVGTDASADLPSDRTRPYAPNTQRLRKPSSSDSGTDTERCLSIAPDAAAGAAQQQSSSSSAGAGAHKSSGPQPSSKGIQSLLDLDVAPTPQALSAVAGIRSSLEYEFRHPNAFASESNCQSQSKQSEIPPPPGLTSGISFEIPGAPATSEAPATMNCFKFTYESSVDGDANEAEELDDEEEEALAYGAAYANYGGYAPDASAAAEQFLSAGNRHKLYGRFFDRRIRNEAFPKKGALQLSPNY